MDKKDRQPEDRVYQYATGRGGVKIKESDYKQMKEMMEKENQKLITQETDDQIKEEVLETLNHCRDFDASQIEVKVYGGEVSLEGRVQSLDEKRLAQDAIGDIAGIKSLKNNLVLNQ
jgi:osmotically-inducible protein OsmY